jgi:hypothetical protein
MEWGEANMIKAHDLSKTLEMPFILLIHGADALERDMASAVVSASLYTGSNETVIPGYIEDILHCMDEYKESHIIIVPNVDWIGNFDTTKFMAIVHGIVSIGGSVIMTSTSENDFNSLFPRFRAVFGKLYRVLALE